jgi:glycosyltransferase involved in cell wall biosynthesis
MRYAAERGIAARLLTPFDLTWLIVYPIFGFGRLVKLFGYTPWVWFYRYGHFVLLRYALMRALRPETPSIVYAHDPLSARAALDAKDAGYSIEVVLAVHSSISQADEWADNGYVRRAGWLYQRITRLEEEVLPRVDRLVFPSKFVAREVRGRIAGVDGVPSWCIPNAIHDAASVPPRVGEPADLISIGALLPNKNHEFLIRVLAEAHRLGYRYRLTIVGAGPLRERLRELAAASGLSAHVVMTGFVPDAARLLPSHRVYVHAARLENCCMAVLEALAAGRPVLAAPTGGIAEQVTDGVEGFHWTLTDPVAAAYRLIRLLEDPVLYERMSRAARRRYEGCYASEKVMPKLMEAVLGSDVARKPAVGAHDRHREAVS